jgi:hypothetical protein
MKWPVFGPKSRAAMAVVTLITGLAASSTAALADSGPMVYGPASNLEVRGEGFSSSGTVELYTVYRGWGGDGSWNYWRSVSAAPVRAICTKPVGVCYVIDQGGWFTTQVNLPGYYDVTGFDCQTRQWAANKPIPANVQPRCATLFVPLFR